MNEENLEHALRIISTRRNSARTQQEERIQEIETRIPEVVEINRQLFRTSRNLLEIIRDGGNVSEQVAIPAAAKSAGAGDDPDTAGTARLSGRLSGTALHL